MLANHSISGGTSARSINSFAESARAFVGIRARDGGCLSDINWGGHAAAIPASPLIFLYRLCRKSFSVPFDDPLIALDATIVANNDAIRGFKPFLISV